MKSIALLICLISFHILADDNEIRLQEKRVKERQQELKDAKDAANPAKEMRKQMRLDEEKDELQRLKDEKTN